VPLPQVPAGYQVLENYSSLKRYWDLLRGLHARGYPVEVPSRTPPDHCRRAVLGVRYPNAAGLLDAEALADALRDEDGPWALEVFTLEPAARAAVGALLDGDAAPIRALLNDAYVLNFDLTLAFTAARQLIGRAATQFWPLDERAAPLPLELPLRARRMGRGELRTLLDRLAGGLGPVR
jgi:hypothetical protein